MFELVETTMCWLKKSSPPPEDTLQVQSFQTAKTMSRLIALHSSLSDQEFSTLLKGPIKSTGVTYLNGSHHSLLTLACFEKLEELDALSSTISRLSKNCTHPPLLKFDAVYSNLKRGCNNLNFNSKQVEKAIHKMEKWVSATSALYLDLQNLSVMESKLKLRRLNLDNTRNYFEDELKDQISCIRKQVRKYKEMSLWNKTFDKSVGPMVLIVTSIFSRICVLFGNFVSGLPKIINIHHNNIINNGSRRLWRVHPDLEAQNVVGLNKLGPILEVKKKWGRVRFHTQESVSSYKQSLMQSAPPNTVGGAGLALRYANIITFTEMQLHSPICISEDARVYMYELLTDSLRAKIRKKLFSRAWEEENVDDGFSDDVWRDVVEGIFGWLGPMAHDTVQWHAEKSLEKQRFDARPKVLLLQTLYFSDLEKTEAAIVEIFVGLSCLYKYKRQR